MIISGKKNLLTYAILITLFSSPNVFAASAGANNDCLANMANKVVEISQRQASKYLQIDADNGNIRKDNESKFLPGTSQKAFIILHGFVASPFEVSEIGRALNQDGGTVYMPLLPGFGSSSKVANAHTYQEWQKTLQDSLELFSLCFSEVSLVGFSTGGGIVTDLLLNNPDISEEGLYKNKIRVKSAALLSPYYDVHSALANILDNIFSLFTDSISVAKLYTLNPTKDLDTFFKNPGYYNQEIPLEGARQVVQLGENLRYNADSKHANSRVPVFAAYSQADQTIKTSIIPNFIQNHFSIYSIFSYEKNLEIPHQIAVPNVNPLSGDLVERVKFFLFQTQARVN